MEPKKIEFKKLTAKEYKEFIKFAETKDKYCPKKPGEFVHAPIIRWY